MKDQTGTWVGYGLGDKGEPVALIRKFLSTKYQWARDLGVTPGDTYDTATSKAVLEFQKRTSLPATGIANLATRIRLGCYPPPPPPRHAMLCFRGTGGILGLDYVDRIADCCARTVERVDVAPELLPSMGMAPVGAATNITALSGNESVDYMVNWAVNWKLHNPDRTLLVAGYSLGAIAATKYFLEFLPGGRLQEFREDFVAAVTLGNPARSYGRTFYLGPIPAGEGISDIRIPEDERNRLGWRWCDLAAPGDLYTNVTGGPEVLKVCRAAYKAVMTQQIHDPAKLIQSMLPIITEALGAAGIVLPGLPGINLGGLGFGAFNNAVTAPGIPGGAPAAVMQAAFQGIKFATTNPPTAPHITYEFAEVVPGRTYLDIGVQHVNDWAGRIPVQL